MSQFSGNYQDPFGQPMTPPKKTSGLAISSLVCSLVGVIPCIGWVTAPLGVLLGAIGIATTGPTAERKGRGIALAGLIIGLLVCIGWGIVAKFGWDFGKEMVVFVMEGPNEALQKGFNNDIAGFQASFHGAGATAPQAEAQAFLDTLEQRFGAFVSCGLNEQAADRRQQGGNQPTIQMPYVLTFANGTANAEVELIFADQQVGLVKKLGFISVEDPTAGNLTYPASVTPPRSRGPLPSSDSDNDADADADASDDAAADSEPADSDADATTEPAADGG